MRIWSLHPRYLDAKGMVALWRETLLAQAVLAGRTKGYQRHPQLTRFRAASAPLGQVATYLRQLHVESIARGYQFDVTRIAEDSALETLVVTSGQLEYEWAHLTAKLRTRAPVWLEQFAAVKLPEPHPSFTVVAGDIADWEVRTATR